MHNEYNVVFEVTNPYGLHMRPAGVVVKILNRYDGVASFSYNENTVDGRSIMGLVMLCAGKGEKIALKIRGSNSKDIANKIIRAINFET